VARQGRIDRGLLAGLTSAEKAELADAKGRIAELEAELGIHRRASELLGDVVSPKDGSGAIAVMAGEHLPVQLVARVLGVSESGYYEWRGRAPSRRAIRHAWLTDLIRQAHADSRGTYGARRVRAELVLGRGISVSYGAVEMLMRQAGIAGITGRPKWRHAKPDNFCP
jgi:putative transposase